MDEISTQQVTEENFTAKQLVFEMRNKISYLGLKVKSLNHIRNVLSRITEDADNKIYNNVPQYFLWDNNDQLQLIDNLMFHLMKELDEEYKEISEMLDVLFQKMKGSAVTE